MLCTVYWNNEAGTYHQNGDIVVIGVDVKQQVIIASDHFVSGSSKSVEWGASSYCEIVRILPIYRKILKFGYVWFTVA
jgi:hypothetical protein